MLEGMCVKTMVFTRPIYFAMYAASGYEKALSTVAQKKKMLAAVSDISETLEATRLPVTIVRQSRRRDASRLNSAASL